MYNIVLNITAALYTGSVYHVLYLYSAYYNTYPLWGLYSISAQNGCGKSSSCWPWQHPGESPIYILHKDKHRTRADDILCKTEYWSSYRRFSSQKPYNTNVSDVPRSLQSWVSTIQTVVLIADVFQLFKKMKNVSCEYDRWVVETQLYKLRDTSDTLIGRAYAMFHL